jgi:hypothetical protein
MMLRNAEELELRPPAGPIIDWRFPDMASLTSISFWAILRTNSACLLSVADSPWKSLHNIGEKIARFFQFVLLDEEFGLRFEGIRMVRMFVDDLLNGKFCTGSVAAIS